MKTTTIMKKSAVFLTALTLAFSAMSFIFILSNNEVNSLDIGEDAPLTEYKMKDVSGDMLSIKDLNKEHGVLVIFSCNTCPFVVGNDKWAGWQGRYNAIQEKCDELGIGMVLVNSNEAKRAKGDSFEDVSESVLSDYVLNMGKISSEVKKAMKVSYGSNDFFKDEGLDNEETLRAQITWELDEQNGKIYLKESSLPHIISTYTWNEKKAVFDKE